MKAIYPRPIFTLLFFTSNQKRINYSQFLAFSTQTHQNSYHPRRHEDESRAVRVSVWWDFENCNVPVNTNAFRVGQCITNAVRANGIKGPIQITAFGDMMQISRTNQEALSSTGISLTHVPPGGKNSADRSLLVDLMYWVSQNPPPAHVFLISGDRDFAGILHRLRMNNYNILLASPDSAPSVLCSASTIMWQWSSLLKGENLTGKLFNQPPDGPHHSWYGHYKAPIEDPFAITGKSSCLVADKPFDVASDSNLLPIPNSVTEQSSCLGADESCDVAPNSKTRSIPRAIMRFIFRVLRSHPEGIDISQLRQELNKSNLSIDRYLYGYKKFSHFLLAMPHILKLHSGNDGQILVRSVSTKSLDESVPAANVEPGTNIEEPEVGSISKTCNERSSSEDVTEKSTVHPAPDPKKKADSTNLQEVGKKEKQNGSSLSMKMQVIKMDAHGANLQNLKRDDGQKTFLPKRITQEIHEQERNVKLKNQQEKVEVPPTVVEKDFSEKNENQLLVPNDNNYTFAFGIFRRTWMKFFGSRDTKSDEASSGKVIVAKRTLSSCLSHEPVGPAWFSPSSHESLIDGRIAQSGDAVSAISSQDSSLSNQTMSWFKFWSSPKCDNKAEKNDETADHFEANTKQLDDNNVGKKSETADHFEEKSKGLEIFAEESFWKEMQSYIDSSEGSASISKSRTREHLVQNLQKRLPFLKSLPESDLLHMVDLLISDKKWVEECNSRIFPFRLTCLAGKDPHNNCPLSSNGLSHIFLGRQPNQESGERKHHDPPHTGVPQPIVHRGSSGKSRSELLADCQKLVDQIVKEHPEGYNIGGFRKLFIEKNGYALDLQKLGCDKLVNLLQDMPEVRIESNLILPAGALKNLDLQNILGSAIDLPSNSSTKDDDSDSDSLFDELGGVDNSGSENEEIRMRLTGKTHKGRPQQGLHDYEPLVEDDFSDSEEETSTTRSENEVKHKLEEESSLMEILDSWYTDKGGDSKKNESTSTANVTDSPEICSQPLVVKQPYKRKSGKRYSFVTEQPVDNKEKLVDGILGSLKNSSEKSANSKVLS